jgi:hypothetical protein
LRSCRKPGKLRRPLPRPPRKRCACPASARESAFRAPAPPAQPCHGGEGPGRPNALRLVQRPQRLLSGCRQTGRDAGHGVRQVRANEPGLFAFSTPQGRRPPSTEINHDYADHCRAARRHRGELFWLGPRPGGALSRGGVVSHWAFAPPSPLTPDSRTRPTRDAAEQRRGTGACRNHNAGTITLLPSGNGDRSIGPGVDTVVRAPAPDTGSMLPVPHRAPDVKRRWRLWQAGDCAWSPSRRSRIARPRLASGLVGGTAHLAPIACEAHRRSEPMVIATCQSRYPTTCCRRDITRQQG